MVLDFGHGDRQVAMTASLNNSYRSFGDNDCDFFVILSIACDNCLLKDLTAALEQTFWSLSWSKISIWIIWCPPLIAQKPHIECNGRYVGEQKTLHLLLAYNVSAVARSIFLSFQQLNY